MEQKYKVMILTAEDSKKVFRMDQERLERALARHPDIAAVADFSITRTSTSYEDAPGWTEADHALFYRDVKDKDVILGYMFPLEGFARHAPGVRYPHHRRRGGAPAALGLAAGGGGAGQQPGRPRP